jgi:hypothetical protein
LDRSPPWGADDGTEQSVTVTNGQQDNYGEPQKIPSL